MMLYLAILIEAFSSTVLPTLGEIIAYAMRSFGGYSMPLATGVSALGVMAGGLLMLGLGRVAAHYYLKNPNARYLKLYDIVHRHWVWALLFTFSPIGFALAFGAGLFRIRAGFAALLMVVGALGYYGWQFLI